MFSNKTGYDVFNIYINYIVDRLFEIKHKKLLNAFINDSNVYQIQQSLYFSLYILESSAQIPHLHGCVVD